MSEYMFGSGSGHLPAKADKIARKHGAWLVNYTDPGCGCGYGCRNNCPARRRHWFAAPNKGSPFDSELRNQVLSAIQAAGIKPKGCA